MVNAVRHIFQPDLSGFTIFVILRSPFTWSVAQHRGWDPSPSKVFADLGELAPGTDCSPLQVEHKAQKGNFVLFSQTSSRPVWTGSGLLRSKSGNIPRPGE
ncbi:hypothetical protein MCOR27_011600 [Pyricularia oryzae]|uniref:Uncharacterized protein n=1 Tax=Pyricularia grisea TaxID=148305 RepID=A0ABQ8P2J6_PYRGI|nr:hypothetical protein MCOR01_009756 [Pyricularia oryzae]KAI6304340.1 hypothetical protein MCOR33_000650 [Pyricularia grisea]KAH9436952.1 hypothetical protein MCOR02_000615 [Pyricularia oryzae]KAI6260006.1 hypothetical protein MCOR19_003623 [Pyricularia oryzae]KAI6264871.1 hypothetical protein MCOR27_011600 [Pyricularia oryzae]